MRPFFLLFITAHLRYALAQDDSSQLLSGINAYRTELGKPALTENKGATCLAKLVITQFVTTACSNATGLDSVQEANYPNFSSWLDTCNIPLDRVKDGQMLPDCVPAADTSNAVSIAVENYTRASVDTYINDTVYTSAGVASSKEWFVLILATNSSTGNYQQQTSGASPIRASLMVLYFILGPLIAVTLKCA